MHAFNSDKAAMTYFSTELGEIPIVLAISE